MSKRFVIEEQCERPEFGDDHDGLCVVDTLTDTVIGCDGGEPEDATLGRGWHWVVVALNRLDAEAQEERVALLERAISAEARRAAAEAICEIRTAEVDVYRKRTGCDCDALRRELSRRDADVRREVRLEYGTRIHQSQQEAQALRAEVTRLRAELFRVTGIPEREWHSGRKGRFA